MAHVRKPSPAVAFVGRHNSGKTTLLEKVITELVGRGVDVGTVKHHGHPGFEIDYPGKDSYRHRAAGASDTVIVSTGKMARVKTLTRDLECDEIVEAMPDHDLVIVEGFRASGLPVIEVMRAANERDVEASHEYLSTGQIRGASPIGVVTDIEEVEEYAHKHGVVVWGLEDVQEICDYLQDNFVRPRLSVIVQAGGESRRMGQSKATVRFLGRPLLARVLERLAPVADELIVTTNEPDNLAFVHELNIPCDVRLVTDIHKARGALLGFHTAMKAAAYPVVAVVACDMIFASAQLISQEATVLQKEHVDAVVPHNKNGFEPFHGVYRVSSCMPAIEKAIEQGDTRVRDFFSHIEVRPFEQTEVLEVMPRGGCFVNANTPEELRRLEELILEDGDK